MIREYYSMNEGRGRTRFGRFRVEKTISNSRHQGGDLVRRESVAEADVVYCVEFILKMLGRADVVGTSS